MLVRSELRLPKAAAIILVALATTALLAMFAAGAGAYAITTFTNTATPATAGQHSDLTTELKLNPTELSPTPEGDLTNLSIVWPSGLTLDPEAVPASYRCKDADFLADLCSPLSRVGALTITAGVDGYGPVTIPGIAYLRVPADNAQNRDVATIGIVLKPASICIVNGFCAVPKKIFIDDHLTHTNTTNPMMSLKESIGPIPAAFTGSNSSVNFTITNWKFTLQKRAGSTGSGRYFVTNSTGCNWRNVIATARATTGTATKTITSPTVSCSNVPAAATIDMTPGETTLDATTGFGVAANVPTADADQQSGRLRAAIFDLPAGSQFVETGLSSSPICATWDVFIGNCTSALQIGIMRAASPQFTGGFAGVAYLTTQTAPYGFAARLMGPRGTSFTLVGSVTNVGPAYEPTSRMRLSLSDFPELPLSSLSFFTEAHRYYLNRGYLGSGACNEQLAVTEGQVLLYNGTRVTANSSYVATPCL